MGEDAVQVERMMTHESQELVVPSPSPTQSPSPSHSLSQLGTTAAVTNGTPDPGAPGAPPGVTPTPPSPSLGGGGGGTLTRDGAASPTGVNAITVLTLLDKLVNMLDQVQENQHKMEVRHADMEGSVRGIQNDMTKLSKSHTSTSNTVSKLLEKSRKVSVHMKEVKDKMDKQAGQVKKLEANHAHLLKRNNFKVLIFQEENEIPSSVFVKEPAPFPREEDENALQDGNRVAEEGGVEGGVEGGLQTINLSSDEELGGEDDDELDETLAALELQGGSLERSRADKLKRSSLKKVDSLKKAFSRQNIEKKMTKIGNKMTITAEQREKIKKSLTPPHPKTSPFKVSPLSFSIRKNRPSSTASAGAGEGEKAPEGEAGVPEGEEGGEGVAPTAVASIELTPISPTEDMPFTELHPQLAPDAGEELKAAEEAMEKEVGGGGAEKEEEEEEEVSAEYALSATLPQDASVCNGTQGAGGDEEEEEEEEVKEEEEKEVAGVKEAAAEEEKEKEVKGESGGVAAVVNDGGEEKVAEALAEAAAEAAVPMAEQRAS
ncbi:caveolae-associated protein 2-like [Engraulis encrasicolus]|uniref:caveolae-associated protein 2-like n=1 Tax=Engraulis encrasicolus TaxID=184585 RepID=UPI002FD1D35A